MRTGKDVVGVSPLVRLSVYIGVGVHVTGQSEGLCAPGLCSCDVGWKCDKNE